jgi:hypothetical protein
MNTQFTMSTVLDSTKLTLDRARIHWRDRISHRKTGESGRRQGVACSESPPISCQRICSTRQLSRFKPSRYAEGVPANTSPRSDFVKTVIGKAKNRSLWLVPSLGRSAEQLKSTLRKQAGSLPIARHGVAPENVSELIGENFRAELIAAKMSMNPITVIAAIR